MGRFRVEPLPLLCLPLGLAASCFTRTKGAVHHQRFWVLPPINAGAYEAPLPP